LVGKLLSASESWSGLVLPTDFVGHRKSGRQSAFPTDIFLPTNCLSTLENFPDQQIIPDRYYIPNRHIFTDQQSNGTSFADQLFITWYKLCRPTFH
jgi:hypothetical protein